MDPRRRGVVALLLATRAGIPAAQTRAKPYRLAWLTSADVTTTAAWTTFQAAMRERGWTEGADYVVENLRYDGDAARLQRLAEEAVARKVDLVICAGTPPAIAARKATRDIPIVFYYVGDPVGAGVVAGLAQPGGNATGLGGLAPGVYAKMVELLKEAAPRTTRVAVLANPAFAAHASFATEAADTARRSKVTLVPVDVRSPQDVAPAFAAIDRQRADAVVVLGQPFLVAEGGRIARLAAERRLPTMVAFEDVVREGALMAYTSRFLDDVRRLPHFVDRILKGAAPATMPVEQPSRFYLIVNLKTADAIGLSVPASIQQRADELIR